MSRSTKKGPYIDPKLFRKVEALNRRGAKEVLGRTWWGLTAKEQGTA